MEAASSRDSSLATSPFSSPNVGALLKIRIISWSQETGLPVTVRVQVGQRTFNLHKSLLYSKSGYFKKRLMETTDLELPESFPGGPETFEMIALFLYGSSTLIDPFNVAALRCAAEFLEMTEEYSSGNLCKRFDLYLNQVVLQRWDDTLIVLQRCQTLLPWAEELLIISRCIESLAFMSCMEILDPERRRDNPVVTLEALSGQAWSCETSKEIASRDLWIKDLIALPFGFFKRIIGSLRRQGMKEKYVSPMIVFYANKWVLSKKTRQFWENSGERTGDSDANCKVSTILQDSVSASIELEAMESIFSTYVSHNMDANCNTLVANSIVAELWDAYLSRLASDPVMDSKRFMELIETIPISFRHNHDPLYGAINTFLQAHRDIPQEEKGAVCKYLNCQKLSQWACIEAVQNELMPLRLIVQALFLQQLNTHQAFKECSESFRYAQYGEFSGSLSSSRCPNSKIQNVAESPLTDGAEPGSVTLSFLLQRDLAMQKSELSRKEYESTSFRIQTLEQELVSLKRSLILQNPSKSRETMPTEQQKRKPDGMEDRVLIKKNQVGQVAGCIGSVNFTVQRKYASRILKVFRQITSFGRRRSKRRPGAFGLWGR